MEGVCRICGCTETEPCVFNEYGDGISGVETCGWLTSDRTLCTNPLCVGAVPFTELLLEVSINRVKEARAL
jgi:hypothetical protein